jgi:hypothetical protein
MSNRLGAVAFLAALAGSVSLLGDVLTLMFFAGPGGGLASVLETVFAAANVAGFLMGLLSRLGGSGTGTAAVHLSWAPVLVVFVLFAGTQPVLAAALVRRIVHLVLTVFGGIADLLTILLT